VTEQPDVTELLKAVNQGDHQAQEQLIAALYRELQRLAASLMSKERAEHTLQPTALVNEAYLRLIQGSPRWSDRAHFFGAAARAMRRVLVEHARRRSARKRGAGARRVTFGDLEVEAEDSSIDLMALDEALEALRGEDPRLVDVVELRYFAGFSIEQTAELLDVSPATVKRHWLYARAWLYDFMSHGNPTAGTAE
jgi:RNA polymerase sigma-70 factor, ECF subfamily